MNPCMHLYLATDPKVVPVGRSTAPNGMSGGLPQSSGQKRLLNSMNYINGRANWVMGGIDSKVVRMKRGNRG